MSDAPPRSPSGLWRSTGASTDLFEVTRTKLAEDLAAKDKLYRWDLTTEHQALIVRIAMLAAANIAFELRQRWTNEQATQAEYDAPTARRDVIPPLPPRRDTADFGKPPR